MELTAVQQIVDAWKNTGQVGFEMWFSENYRYLIEDEKQQIVDAWIEGNAFENPKTIYRLQEGRRYYNETFTDKKQQQ